MPAMELKLLGCLLQLLGLLAAADAICNVCNAVNNLTCYSSTQMQACDTAGLPTGPPQSCPAGYVCVSGPAGVICQPSGSGGSSADCLECNKCDASRTFACTSTTSFALCLGTDTPQSSRGSCAPGYVCSREEPQICGLDTQSRPTCSYADDDPSTAAPTAPPTAATTPATPSTDNANAYCGAVQSQGEYAVGDYTETTCRQYIKCFLRGGAWHGQQYTCPGRLYFNASSQMCVSAQPARCYTPVSTAPPPTTAVPTPSNPNAYCGRMQAQDYFPVGTDPASSCRQYVYCYLSSGSWRGALYTCPGSTYYDSARKTCATALPPTCSSRIAALSLNGVALD